LLDLALTLVMAAHLLAVNVATAGPLVCLWLDSRRTRGDTLAGETGRYLARQSLWMLLWGMLLGGGLVALMWFDAQSRLLALVEGNRWLQTKLWFGLSELAFYFVCMGAYLAVWDRLSPQRRWGRWGHRLLAVLAFTNLLYHFPPLFAVLARLQMEPSALGTAGQLDRASFLRLMFSGQTLSMVAHFFLASLAVTGGLLMGRALRLVRTYPDDAPRLARWGGSLALIATLLQLVVGVLVLLDYPSAARSQLMGGDLLATVLLAASILAAVGLMHFLATVALGDTSRRSITSAMALLVVTVLLMCGTMQRARRMSLPEQSAGQSSPQNNDRSAEAE